MNVEFKDPWCLVLLGIVPLLIWHWRRRRPTTLAYSSSELLRLPVRTWRQRLSLLVPCLHLIALGVLIVALARPREGKKETLIETEGIAIELLIDRSGSMRALDFTVDSNPTDRLSAVKEVATKFVLGDDKQLTGRSADLIGLVVFARYADSLVPPTLDHNYLKMAFSETEIVWDPEEDGTAIGDALGLGVEKLEDLQQSNSTDGKPVSEIKSKIVILLTDGESNAGTLDPIPAAELAAARGIKVYAIGVGTQGYAKVPVEDPFTGRLVLRDMQVNIDEATLTKIAEITGGKYFRATDSDSLASIYAEIDQLEKSQLEERSYVEYLEFAIDYIPFRGREVWPLLVWALIAFCLATCLEFTLFRRSP
ncbi:MAG: VWA domain-containing protein [Planctomycetales bacterium]|nr:VWA domain-containing protein [Planctomycetales bacterium]